MGLMPFGKRKTRPHDEEAGRDAETSLGAPATATGRARELVLVTLTCLLSHHSGRGRRPRLARAFHPRVVLSDRFEVVE